MTSKRLVMSMSLCFIIKCFKNFTCVIKPTLKFCWFCYGNVDVLILLNCPHIDPNIGPGIFIQTDNEHLSRAHYFNGIEIEASICRI